MSSEPDPTISKRVDDGFLRKVIWALLAMVLTGGIASSVTAGKYMKKVDDHERQLQLLGGVNDIAEAVSSKLTKNYMTRPDVIESIRIAREELRIDQRTLMAPVNKKLDGIEQDIKYLVRREIAKGDKK